jgi:uncharacterized membrane protein
MGDGAAASRRHSGGDERKEVEMGATIGALVAHVHHWWFAFFPLLWFSVIVLFWTLFWRRGRWHHHHYGGHGGASVEQVLGERYARGEITEEEYRQRRTVLRDG